MSHDEKRLRDAFASAPSAPTAPGYGARLADAARRRRAARTSLLSAGAVVTVIAVTAAIGGFSPDDDRAPSASPRSSGTPTATDIEPAGPVVAPSCPPLRELMTAQAKPGAGTGGEPVVPANPVAARLCGGLIDNGGFDMAWPSDALEGAPLSRVVSKLNNLPPYVEPEACDLPLSIGFNLVLAYPDGSTVLVNGDTSGSCEHVTVAGGSEWAGAPSVLDTLRDALRDQRAAVGPVDDPQAADCPQSWQDVAFTLDARSVEAGDPVAVTACEYRLENGDPNTITQSWDGTLVEQIVAERAQELVRQAVEGSRDDPCNGVAYELDHTQQILLVRDGWGDVHTVPTEPCWPSTFSGQRRYPTDSFRAAVNQLVDVTPAT